MISDDDDDEVLHKKISLAFHSGNKKVLRLTSITEF